MFIFAPKMSRIFIIKNFGMTCYKREGKIFEDSDKDKIKSKLSQTHEVGNIDNSLISRVLLTKVDYRKQHGGTNWSFGWNNYWKKIFLEQTPN